MSQDDSGALAALSALLGYVGAEAATTTSFEHLFWPQRHLSNFSWHDILAAALLLPMGGPLHKAALSTFDTLHQHGIFKGARRGHMLGTAFFSDIGWNYVMYKDRVGGEQKAMRNCLWATALGLLDVREAHARSISDSSLQQTEKGLKSSNSKATVRAHISTFHLHFSRATVDDMESTMPFVREDLKTPGPRVFLALIAAESSAIIMAAVLAAVWRTPWAILWIVPFILRLVGALTAVHREPLETLKSPEPEQDEEKSRDFEVICPQSNGDFMIFSGPPSVIQQFMRHYGHPVRSRPREIVQLSIVVAIGFVFPAGLVFSSLLMPIHLQYAWFGYQIFLVTGLHFARYSQYTRRFSTDAAIAQAFARQDPVASSSILFGHERRGAGTLRVDMTVLCHARHAEGKMAAQEILRRRDAQADSLDKA